ncbi:MAG TPA: hypothetical protein VGK74_20645 [Symbiobacteriaceae bacterium]|jgi:hypothetical protein
MQRNRLIAYVMLALFLATLVTYLAHPAEAVLTAVGNAAQTVALFAAAVYIYRAAGAFSKEDTVRRYWMWLGTGLLLNATGYLIYGIMEVILHAEMSSPSLPDLFWILSYPVMIYPTVALLRGYLTSGLPIKLNPWSWVLTGAALVISGYFLVLPILQDTEIELLKKLVPLIYPVGDAIIFAAAVSIALMMRQFGAGRLGTPWTFLALGMIAASASDMVYTYLSAQDLYQTGNLIDLGWVLQGFLMAWGGILQYQLIKGDTAVAEAAA